MPRKHTVWPESNITIKSSLFTKAEWTNLGIIDSNFCIIKAIDMENG